MGGQIRRLSSPESADELRQGEEKFGEIMDRKHGSGLF